LPAVCFDPIFPLTNRETDAHHSETLFGGAVFTEDDKLK